MVDWKELGEIPDSEDDEASDNQEISQRIDGASVTSPSKLQTASTSDHDIWAFPDSQPDAGRPDCRLASRISPGGEVAHDSELSSPLTSIHSEDNLLSGDESCLEVWKVLRDRDDHHGDDHTSQRPGTSAMAPNPTVLLTNTLRSAPVDEAQQPAGAPEGNQDHRLALRLERSLRPRKPIQEHPYLLENAQYSHALKAHGLKPWRIAREIAGTVSHDAISASQDEDFQEESQDSERRTGGISTILDESDGGIEADQRSNLEALSSTPQEPSPTSGRIRTSSPNTTPSPHIDSTGLVDDDLPTLQELLTRPPKLAKRKRLSPDSSGRKRRRRNIIDSDPIESRHSPQLLHRASLDEGSSPVTLHSPLSQSASTKQHTVSDSEPARNANTASTIHGIVISSDEGSEKGSEVDSETDTMSENEEETVHAMGRRIRGVLPASYLRLDQHASRVKERRFVTDRVRLKRLSENDARRGVAVPRISAGNSASPLIFDESEDESGGQGSRAHTSLVGPALDATLFESHSPVNLIGRDDEEVDSTSVIEDDSVDLMLPPLSTKAHRSSQLHDAKDKERIVISKRDKLSDHERRRVQTHQTKLIENLRRHDTGYPASRQRSVQQPRNMSPSRSHRGRMPRLIIPPPLSILDTIMADAPRFLRIAARAAASRRKQGRSSPQKKFIQLATRLDQLDAASVLDAWRSGLIIQRDSVTAAIRFMAENRGRSATRVQGADTSQNAVSNPRLRADLAKIPVKWMTSKGVSKNTAPQTAFNRSRSEQSHQSSEERSARSRQTLRPALFETEGSTRLMKLRFDARKQTLDRLFKARQVGSLSVQPPLGLYTPPEKPLRLSAANPTQFVTPDLFVAPSIRPNRTRHRKTTRPRRIDISSPQYTHDHPTVSDACVVESEPHLAGRVDRKLQGLYPYGSQYTHDFGMSPLRPGVFFHVSTLIGSGRLYCLADLANSHLKEAQQPALSLDDHVLQWGRWDAAVSSEFGMVMDFITEDVIAQISQRAHEKDETTAVQAASFLLSYTEAASGFVGQGQRMALVPRIRECLQHLNGRVESACQSVLWEKGRAFDDVLQVYDRLLLLAFVVLSICRAEPDLRSEVVASERLVEETAAVAMTLLVKLGIRGLQITYRSLADLAVRERGIRQDSSMIHTWVMLVQILGVARIPRCSFWNIVHRFIISEQCLTSMDARDFEVVWEDMFTLLPLIEFNDFGIVESGLRHVKTHDGWSIPQTLLTLVFKLYRANQRQLPSFNEYCRALVSRCYHLVSVWGWRKCVSVIGSIFDFFGAQGLAHLRNEEVYKSPSFLENLASKPDLKIEAQDPCFHVFLKLVAVAVQKSLQAGAPKDVGNLVSRTIPNHDRQHRKEDNVLARDLAALRNHHDLLCTLFWAAPAEYRPAASLIQNLVNPTTSHKEACLINLRAWVQLARFVITSEQPANSWKPFHAWRVAFFDQIFKQYNEVAPDVRLQLANLGREASRSINEEIINQTITSNEAALMDILILSARASLDVLQHAPNLTAATFAMNLTQLRTLFNLFSGLQLETERALVRAAITTVETFLAKIDDFKAREESQQSESQILDSAVADDALLVLDQELSPSFFGMTRRITASCMNDEASSLLINRDRTSSLEQIVIVAARMTARFVDGGLLRLTRVFNKGKYQIFERLPRELDLSSRKYLVLFMSSLLEYGLDMAAEFDDSLLELWMLSLIKPHKFLKYEMRLACQLASLGKPFVPNAVVALSCSPDYSVMRDLFEAAITYMRKSVREAGPRLAKDLTTEYSTILKAIMTTIRNDLKTISSEPLEHRVYVEFVQMVVSLIKVHASELCTIDSFFYQTSAEYSPAVDDPQLQVASLLSYGLRLQEGDARSCGSLFYLLFNNAKFSIADNKLQEQIILLRKGLSDPGIKTFILSKMVPAVITASCTENNAFPLLDIYVEALRLHFAGSAFAGELFAEDLDALRLLQQAVLDGFEVVRGQPEFPTMTQLHMIRQVIALSSLWWPSLRTLSTQRPTSQTWRHLWTVLSDLWSVLSAAQDYLEGSGTGEERNGALQLSGLLLRPNRPRQADSREDPDVVTFSENIVQDVRKDWRLSDNGITIYIQGRNREASERNVMSIATWELHELVRDVHERVQEWCWWWRELNPSSMVTHILSEFF